MLATATEGASAPGLGELYRVGIGIHLDEVSDAAASRCDVTDRKVADVFAELEGQHRSFTYRQVRVCDRDRQGWGNRIDFIVRRSITRTGVPRRIGIAVADGNFISWCLRYSRLA